MSLKSISAMTWSFGLSEGSRPFDPSKPQEASHAEPDVTEFEIPESLTAAGGVFKFEIIARTSTGNNTAIESCFRMQ
jgi:hypothetical protein